MGIKKEYDAVIIGGGHMSMTLGTYLSRAGMETAVFERRHEEGGAIFSNECTAPGFIHNLHAQYMEFIEWMPIWYDFNLPQYGARTIYPHAQSGLAFSDGRPPLIIYSVEHEENYDKTYKSVAQYSKHDAETLVGIIKKIREMKDEMAKGWYNPAVIPTPENPEPDHAMGIMLLQYLGIPTFVSKMTSKDTIDYLFESDEMRSMFYRLGIEWGWGLDDNASGAAWFAALSVYFNWQLMVGGTHTLAHAIEMAGVQHGMELFESSEVVKILLEGKRAVGVKLQDGTEVRARKLVASGADIKGTFLRMVGEENLSPLWKKRVHDFEIGPSCVLGSTAMALHEAPDFKSAKWNPDINKCFYTIVGYDSAAETYEYCHDAHNGKIPKIYAEGIWVNSLWDPTYAPPGKHSLTGWIFLPKASYYSRAEWEEFRATWNGKFLKNFERFAPNMTPDNVIDDFVYTPLDQQDDLHMMEGDFGLGSSKLSQVGHNRPWPEASQYRTEIEGLYLCGSFCHPGGGACAGPGYNAYKIIAEDFGLDKHWEKLDRGY